MATRACLCGVPNCRKHGRRSSPSTGAYGAAYQSVRAVLLRRWNSDPTTRCWICTRPAFAGDPWEPDHLIEVANGGGEHPSNLRPAHRSCNRKRGAELASRRRKEAADHRAAERIRQTEQLIGGRP